MPRPGTIVAEVIGHPERDAAALILAADFDAVLAVLAAMNGDELTEVLTRVLAIAHTAAQTGQRMDVAARRVLADRRRGEI